MSTVTVPVFGFGIRPRGPSTLPSLPTARIMSGVATTASKSIQPPWIFSTISSPPTMIGAGLAALPSACRRRRSPARVLVLPSPCGSTTVPRTIWSACFGSTPRRSASSTVSSNFANFTFCIRGTASSIVCGRSGTCCLRGRELLAVLSACVTSCGANGRSAASHSSIAQFRIPGSRFSVADALESPITRSCSSTRSRRFPSTAPCRATVLTAGFERARSSGRAS